MSVNGCGAILTSGWRATWAFGVAMIFDLRRRHFLVLDLFFATTLAGCASWITYGDGDLRGHVVVVWNRQDKFIYVPDNNDLFSFRPSL